MRGSSSPTVELGRELAAAPHPAALSATRVSGPGGRELALHFEDGTAGYGPAVASTAHSWELVGVPASG
eukprot:1809073-Rhodomonas_salina.2